MKFFYSSVLFFIFSFGNTVFAQISHGGIPLFLNNSSLRSFSSIEYIDMLSFNLDSVKQMDELNRENMRTSFQFAYKFYTRIEKGKQGSTQVLADGTKVWQVGIHSKDAYSINLLFTKYHLPEGGKLFLYNADHTHIIGSFDHRNNSPEQILPVRPIAGDAIIVEYSEPAGAAFEGELIIGEVNHDYRDIRAVEPAGDLNNFQCMQDIACTNVDEKIARSTVLLTINGTYCCTGSLVNNTDNDETPYLLTAVHCLNDSLGYAVSRDWGHYDAQAKTIIAFFNYNRSVCGTFMKATEEMSLAVTTPRVIIEGKDVALLEFREKPLLHYNAYYAGWNMDGTNNLKPFSNIHHPNGAVKKFGSYDGNLTLMTAVVVNMHFDSNSHWEVPGWTIGSTWGGSSGSPLFDNNNLIVGTLTGGASYCNGTNPNGASDIFAALYKSWEQTDPNNQLKTYLNPGTEEKKKQDGYDPHAENPLHRIGNANYNDKDTLIISRLNAPDAGLMFGNNSLGTLEFAEEFTLEKPSEILGVYLLIPQMPFSYTSGVEIEIYSGTNAPETRLKNQPFLPQYLTYSKANSGFQNANKNTNKVGTESFVAFDNPVNVGKHFFVAYKIQSSTVDSFLVCNTQFASPEQANTAWIKDGQQWIKASEYTPQPIKTSLALQPLVRFTNDTSVTEINNKTKRVYYDRTTDRLTFTFEPESPGQIFIYSVSGQLIERISYSKGEKSFKLSSFSNQVSIKIVKISGGNELFSEKIIY